MFPPRIHSSEHEKTLKTRHFWHISNVFSTLFATRFERATFRLGGGRSIQLSYANISCCRDSGVIITYFSPSEHSQFHKSFRVHSRSYPFVSVTSSLQALLTLPFQQQCRVRDDQHRTCIMDQRTYHRIQRSNDRQHNRYEIQRHGEGHIQLDRDHQPL